MKKKNKKKTPAAFYKKAAQKAKRKTPAPRVFHEEKKAAGTYRGTRRGFGFVTLDGGEWKEDVFIPLQDTNGALDGDRVAVKYHVYETHRNAKPEKAAEGRVTDILSYGKETLVGVVREGDVCDRHGIHPLVFLPENPRFPSPLPLVSSAGAKIGDKAEGKLLRHGNLAVKVLTVFGNEETRGANYAAVLADCNVPIAFADEAIAEAAERASVPLSREGRTDKCGEIIFTIDGRGAKDLDDAVSLSLDGAGCYHLGVHIADVSEYVRPHTPLDKEANARGSSVYFTDRVVPMLPEALSNGACSLNAGEEKYALSAEMVLDGEGNLKETKLQKSVVCSRVRGVYEEVNDWFEKGQESPFAEKYAPVKETLSLMRRLFSLLEKKSKKRGGMELDRPEAVILLDGEGNPTDVQVRERGEAEKMIEQFMLTANEAVATFAEEKGIPCVYRLHDKPTDERLHDFLLFASNSGLDIRPLQKPPVTGKAFSALLAEAEEKGVARPVSYMVLRTMAKAEYGIRAGGHFGLGISRYCHFTSPIRRLSDLATHRMLKAVCFDGEAPKKYEKYAALAADCANEGELRAQNAERQIEALYKALYMKEKIGNRYEAHVSSVTPSGIFCELANTCEGLVPLASLPAGTRYEEETMTVVTPARTYRLGDAVEIEVKAVSVSRRQVDFSLPEEEEKEKHAPRILYRRPAPRRKK